MACYPSTLSLVTRGRQKICSERSLQTAFRYYAVYRVPPWDSRSKKNEKHSLVPVSASSSAVAVRKAPASSGALTVTKVVHAVKKLSKQPRNWVTLAKEAFQRPTRETSVTYRLHKMLHDRLDRPTQRFLQQEEQEDKKEASDNRSVAAKALQLTDFAVHPVPLIAFSGAKTRLASTSTPTPVPILPRFEPYPRLRLSKLPYEATVPELRHLFRGYHLAPIDQPVELIEGIPGRPSGFAYVYFATTHAAASAKKNLNFRWAGRRYIAVDFDCADKPKPRVQRFPLHINRRVKLPIPHSNYG